MHVYKHFPICSILLVYSLVVDTPTLPKLMTMKGADGKPLNIIQVISTKDYQLFGMCLLEDENGTAVDLIERDHVHSGVESITRAILKQWLESTAAPRTYQHLIECLRETGGLGWTS